MPASGVSAAAIAARLSDIGLPARVEEHDRYASVQAEVPESLSAALTVVLSRAPDTANYRHPLAGEENALVRPYMLAWERRARPRAVVVAPHLPAEAWSSLAGVR
ncbi:hypothetical protein [Streptomyces chartreusis]|uniref:hypothetical protein n=1 Tax=Streptomyces chartreusis TaxID=1969 RepID=UPI0037FD1A86